MQGFGIVAVADELVGYFLCLNLCAAEDNGKDAGIIVHDALQGEILVLGIDHIIDMVDVLSTLITTAYHNLLVVV